MCKLARSGVFQVRPTKLSILQNTQLLRDVLAQPNQRHLSFQLKDRIELPCEYLSSRSTQVALAVLTFAIDP